MQRWAAASPIGVVIVGLGLGLGGCQAQGGDEPSDDSGERASGYGQSTDPGWRGASYVSRVDYDFGDEALSLPDSLNDVEFRGSVFYPDGFGDDGPSPLIVILHGRHPISFQGDVAGFDWPPPAGFEALPNHLGHERLAQHLASRGFVVATISGNGIAASDFGPTGYRGQVLRTRLIQEHLGLLADANEDASLAPFDGELTGRIDLEHIGLLGHSRGAEAALINAVINNGDAGVQLGAGLGSDPFAGAGDDLPQFDIDAVFAVAPSTITSINVNDTPMAVMISYADGDAGLGGVRHYEASLYNRIYTGSGPADTAPKHLIFAMGANHNFFNENWIPFRFPVATGDDIVSGGNARQDCHVDGSPGNYLSGRLSADQQLDMLDAYATAFFETYLEGSTAHLPVLTGTDLRPFMSTGLVPEDVIVTYQAPDDVAQRLDINRFDSFSHANFSTGFGTPVVLENIDFSFLAGGPQILSNDQNGGQNSPFILLSNVDGGDIDRRLEPHSRGFGSFGMGALRVMTSSEQPGQIVHTTGGPTDVSGFDAVQFRLGVHFENEVSSVEDSEAICERRFERKLLRWQNFGLDAGLLPDVETGVRIVDGAGNEQTIDAIDFSAALFVPPGEPGTARLIMNQVRIPLDAFDAIDLTGVTEITLEFGPDADVQVSDLALVSSPGAP
ncbi:MAG: hypothetical protein K0V04_05255 [Deltaproteobacteria bacterium]|nr:hypothetical protein [Deltaproteobacteria bacterium]